MSGYAQLPPQGGPQQGGFPQPPHMQGGAPPQYAQPGPQYAQPGPPGQPYGVPQYNVVQVQQPGVYVKPYSNQMLFSILVCLLCFWPIGLYTIYLSSQANDALSRSDMVRAGQLSSQARTLNWVAFCIGLVCVIIPIFLFVVMWGVWFHTVKIGLQGFNCENTDGISTSDCMFGQCGVDSKSGCGWCEDGYLVSDDGLCTSAPNCNLSDSLTHKICTGCDFGYTLSNGVCNMDTTYICYKTINRLGAGTTHCLANECGLNNDRGCTNCELGWNVVDGGCQ